MRVGVGAWAATHDDNYGADEVDFLKREVESNMANVKGTLKVLKKNDYGFYSVKIDDTWYGTGSKNEPSGVVTGDTVEGEFELEKGKYKTITKAGLRKAAGAPAEVPTSLLGNPKSPPTDWAAKDASIRYQSSRKDALAYWALPGALEAAGFNKAKLPEKIGLLDALLDKKTAEYYEDVATFGAVTRVNMPGSDPAAPASDDTDDE